MTITAEDVQHIARLSRLKTQPEQAEFYAEQLNNIMTVVDQMNAVDTSSIEPMSHPQDTFLRLREDQITSPNQRDDLMKIAPASSDGLFLVPKVIE